MWTTATRAAQLPMTDSERLAAALFGSATKPPVLFSTPASGLPAWMQTNAPAPQALPPAAALSATNYFEWLLDTPAATEGSVAVAQPEWLPLSSAATQAAALQPVANTQELPAWLLEDTPAASGRHRPETTAADAAPPAPDTSAPTASPTAPASPAAPANPAAAATTEAAHSQQLTHARSLLHSGNQATALPIYAALVEAGQLLEAVLADLQAVPQAANPHARQLLHILGDAYMKHGQIPAALQCYQSALHQPNP